MAFINTHRQSSASLDYIFEYEFYYSFAYDFKFFAIIASIIILVFCLVCAIFIACCRKIKVRAQTFVAPKKSVRSRKDTGLGSFNDEAVEDRVKDY